MQVGDIISIKNSNHLEVIFEIYDTRIRVKPLAYDMHYSRVFSFESCSLATDDQICTVLSEWVKDAYLNKLRNEI